MSPYNEYLSSILHTYFDSHFVSLFCTRRYPKTARSKLVWGAHITHIQWFKIIPNIWWCHIGTHNHHYVRKIYLTNMLCSVWEFISLIFEDGCKYAAFHLRFGFSENHSQEFFFGWLDAFRKSALILSLLCLKSAFFANGFDCIHGKSIEHHFGFVLQYFVRTQDIFNVFM